MTAAPLTIVVTPLDNDAIATAFFPPTRTHRSATHSYRIYSGQHTDTALRDLDGVPLVETFCVGGEELEQWLADDAKRRRSGQ